ncbi:hypothetical protein NIES4073_25580 [Kalymmatonema gypsitolerans NIES-4073]|nr:hypothetical protein NIES4073_25580 [Scytonema sp. NIES-4073]
MAERKVVNLQSTNINFEELSDEEMESVIGGTGSVFDGLNSTLATLVVCQGKFAGSYSRV